MVSSREAASVEPWGRLTGQFIEAAGAPLFHMSAHLRLPTGLAASDVQAALEAISGEIMVDVAVGNGLPRVSILDRLN